MTMMPIDTSTLGPIKVEPPRKFPVLGDGKRVGYVSWEVAELLRPQAMRNHGQTLERLAERGGLTWQEMAWALAGVGLRGLACDRVTAQTMMAGAAHAVDRMKSRPRLADTSAPS